MSVTEKAIRAIQQLPEDADYRAVAEKIEFMQAVDEGLQQSKEGKTLTAAEVRQRLSTGLSA